MTRSYGRSPFDPRPITIIPHFYDYTEGSCLVKFGNTEVLCVATVDESVPPHMKNKQKGWITAEYAMLPRSSKERIRRDKVLSNGRTQEIQRLIGRSLRAISSLEGWGERTIILDCDVINADGGTRTASITGAFVSLTLALRYLHKNGKISPNATFPIQEYLSAISVGLVKGEPFCDLDYVEDSSADADMNVVVTSSGKIVEIQGTAESDPFSQELFHKLVDLGTQGCFKVAEKQKEILGPLGW